MHSLKSSIVVFLLTCCAAFAQSRVWSSPSYGKVDPREWMPESLYTNCVLWMPMNNDPAQFGTWGVPDGSASRNNGGQTNISRRLAYTIRGRGSLSADGIDDTFSVPSSPSLNFEYSRPFCFAAWVYVYTNNMVIAHKRLPSSPFSGWYCSSEPAGAGVRLSLRTDASNLIDVYANTTFTTGAWHHIVIQHKGSVAGTNDVEIFINGVKRSLTYNQTGNITTFTNTSPITFASYASSYSRFIIDDVMLLNTMLSTNDVNNLYTITKTTHPYP